MTLRDLANELLDLRLWQAVLLYPLLVFLRALGRALGRDTYYALRKRRQ